MTTSLPIIAAILLYLAATFMTILYIRAGASENGARPKIVIAFVLAFAALALHLIKAINVSFTDAGALNFSLNSMAIVVSAMVVLVYLLAGLAMPIRRLGVMVYPLTMISLVFSLLWGDDVVTTRNHSPLFNAHVLISIAAYALLAIAAIQSLLYVYQERQIKNRTKPAMLMALPPLQTMETLLFRLLGTGFFLLSLTLFSGAMFSQHIFGHAFTFSHHTVLAVLGWIVFAILLFKRVKTGLRGSQAVWWTVGGFALIQLGYFGTKIVSESLSVQ